MINQIISILLVICFVIPQEPCVGTCYTEEEEINIESFIQELEQKDSINVKLIESLNSTIYMYIQKSENDSLWLDLQEKKLELLDNRVLLYNDLIKEVKPKWYENKWLWFTIGVITTAGSIKIAGELVD